MKKGIDLSNIDTSVSPKQDFYKFATGGWSSSHPLTGEYSRFGMFDLLREANRDKLKELITGLSSTEESKHKGSIAQKISDLYALGLDEERLNREGATPLMPYLKQVENLNRENFYETLAWMHLGPAGGVLYASGVSADPGDAKVNILHIGETGLGLGDRDYYLEDNDTNKKIREAYAEYVQKIMRLAGYDGASAERIWHSVWDLEYSLAKVKMTREERRNPLARYNKIGRNELSIKWPHIDWEAYFKNLEIKDFSSLNVLSPGYFDGLDKIMANISIEQLKDYFLYNVVAESTGLLSDEFYDASFEMYDRVMSGKEEHQPRWKRAMALPGSMLGEAVGQLYVEKYFPQKNKEYMLQLVENLRTALSQHIRNLSWMGETTKAKALEKLSSMRVKIGYPDKWKDYSEIIINPEESYLENVLVAAKWYIRDNYSKLGEPVDLEEWHMTPQTVNAYYSPTTNEICFPAGILQPPYFDVEADDAINYGAIGVVIGHEMTHGFDDQGRRFNKEGNLSDWWSAEDSERFSELTKKLVEQFNKVEVAPGVYANGEYTLGENIADQGGLRIALTAYQNSQTENDTVVNNDGFTSLQRFYLGYATLWASNIRDEEILLRTKTDPHSLECNRVNVTLRNLTPFMQAFDIKEGDAMYMSESERTVIW